MWGDSAAMDVRAWLFVVLSALLSAVSQAVLRERNCSTCITLQSQCTTPEAACKYLSDILKQYNGLIAAGDCLEIKLTPGTYVLADYNTTLNYSLVMRALEPGAVSISCQQLEQENIIRNGSPFWFQRYDAFSSHRSPIMDNDGEFFVQLEGVHFERCLKPLQFDAMDYVGLSNCTFV